jgi:dTDP-glucose 4,6-dehydratase
MGAMRVLITGGVGFIGLHLSRLLLHDGVEVVAFDNLSASQIEVARDVLGHDRFELVEGDVTEPIAIDIPLDAIVHLAGPIDARDPINAVRVGSLGTLNVLELARTHGARIVLASSGAVYGDPLISPQSEGYRGNADPVGPRSSYDEAKRFLEAASTAYRRHYGLNTGIVRPFNIYGPDRHSQRRAIPKWVTAALRGETLTVFGGEQTRSLCWVEDFAEGVRLMLHSDFSGPVNLGSPTEVTMAELAQMIVDSVGSGQIEVLPGKEAESTRRCPDVTAAREVLNWSADTDIATGIATTVERMRTMP